MMMMMIEYRRESEKKDNPKEQADNKQQNATAQ
jgi:hypothetical protein